DNPAADGHQYITLSGGDNINDYDNIDSVPSSPAYQKTSLVIYTETPQSNKDLNIIFVDRRRNKDCKARVLITYKSPDGRFTKQTSTTNPGNVNNCGQAGSTPASFPSVFFEEIKYKDKNGDMVATGLYKGYIDLTLEKSYNGYKQSSFTISTGSARLGYAGQGYVNVYPTALAYGHDIKFVWSPPCDGQTENSKVFYEDGNEGRSTDKVNSYIQFFDARLKIYENGRTIQTIEKVDSGSPSLSMSPGAKYKAIFSNIDGGNGISFKHPFDSGNYYIPCPNVDIKPPTPVWYLKPNAEGKAQAGSYYPLSGKDKDGNPIDYHDANVSSALNAFAQARIALSVQETKNQIDVKSGEHNWDVQYYFARTEGGQSGVYTKNTNYTANVIKDRSATFTENSQVPTGSGSGIDYLTGNGRDPGTHDQYCERLVRDFTPTNGNGADPASPYTCVQLNGPCISVPWQAIGSSRTEGDPGNGGTPEQSWVTDRYTFYYNFYNQGPAANTRPISFIHNGSYDSSRTLGEYSPNYNRTIVATDGGSTITDSMSFSPTQEDKQCNTSGNQSYSNKLVVPYYFHITPAIKSEPRVQQGDIITPDSSITLPIQNSDGTRYHTWSDDTKTQLAEVINPKPSDSKTLATKFPDPSDSEADPCAYVA
ncbi:MAG: hypothetical protein ACR2KZ_05830, partial [Segetibacter sp.]